MIFLLFFCFVSFFSNLFFPHRFITPPIVCWFSPIWCTEIHTHTHSGYPLSTSIVLYVYIHITCGLVEWGGCYFVWRWKWVWLAIVGWGVCDEGVLQEKKTKIWKQRDWGTEQNIQQKNTTTDSYIMYMIWCIYIYSVCWIVMIWFCFWNMKF